MNIYLHGRDNVGWSIDSDRAHTARFLTDLGHTITKNFVTAQILHSVWWAQLSASRNFFLRLKRRIIATVTNKLETNNGDYLRSKKWVTLWIAPSKKQFEILKAAGVNVAYQPFYVNKGVFKRSDKSRNEVAALLDIDKELIKGKFLIGSFQRDTLGTDLITPKWQKGPELLIEILSTLPDRDKWLLVLAGPRRHFIINECEKRGIPYYYYGVKPAPGVDDISVNTLDEERMSLLYNLVDCYLVTSKSESGPKAILEASFCKTLIFSTDVGLAPDILNRQCIYEDVDYVSSYIAESIKNGQDSNLSELIQSNYSNAVRVCSYDVMRERWKQIYESIQDSHPF